MRLTVLERITLLQALPAEGNLVTLRIVRELREALSFREEEMAELGMTVEQDKVVWDSALELSAGKDIAIGEKATDLCVESLKQLDRAGKLKAQHLTLCEKFLPAGYP